MSEDDELKSCFCFIWPAVNFPAQYNLLMFAILMLEEQ